MEKGKRRAVSPWGALTGGAALSLGLYLLWALLESLLLVKGAMPESGAFPLLGAACLCASLAGALRCAAVSPWGRMAAACACAAVFAAVLAAVGLLCWEGVAWTGRGGVLLLCALAGGLLAGLTGGRGRRGKRKRPLKGARLQS
ncbi:hypothetical protein [Dysosmobacter sp.]|uniref:hypothetical protein n=1 Tax=Dysosmobacter sp. TaxID=2591382 RepID=UPI002A8EC999|nr:hypothetical protein [Dysosmobacter sp.]MDY3984956.1 hypothetical protein [Dysosmobacter sp.]